MVDKLEDYQGHDPTSEYAGHDVPQAQQPEVNPYKPTGSAIFERLMGTDVNDPIPLTRMGTEIIGGFGGMTGGAALGATIGGSLGSVEPGGGTAVGAAIGAGIGGLLGSGVGTSLGAAAPEAVLKGAEYMGLVSPEYAKSHSLNMEDLKTVMKGDAVLDMITGGALTAGRLAWRPMVRGFTKSGGKANMQLADYAAENGINLLPIQVGNSRIPRGFVSVMGKFPLVGRPIAKRIMQSDKEFQEAFSKLPKEIAPLATMDEVTKRVVIDAQDKFKAVADDFAAQRAKIFANADAAGIGVVPNDTVSSAMDILKKIGAETPRVGGPVEAGMTGPMKDVKKFLENDLLPIVRTTQSGLQETSKQSMTQMNTILEMVDTKIAKLYSDGSAPAIRMARRLEDLKQSVQLDMYTKMKGPGAGLAGKDLQELDQEYSLTMNKLFNGTKAGSKINMIKGGVYGIGENAVPDVDKLTSILMKDDSIEGLNRLKEIVTPETFKAMSASKIDSIFEGATHVDQNSLRSLDIQGLRKELGFTNPDGLRYKSIKHMLELSGGVSMDQLDTFLKIGERIGSVEAPNASTFIARRATMGGLHAIASAIIPVASGPALGSHGGMIGTLIGGLVTIGGPRFAGHVLTDPLASKYLTKVMQPEMNKVARKKAFLGLAHVAIDGMMDAGYYTADEGMNLFHSLEDYAGVVEKKVQEGYDNEQGPGPQVPNTP